MAIPNIRTPIVRCIQAAYYTERMLLKFPQRPALIDASGILAAARKQLASSTHEAADAELLTLYARADVAYIDYVADEGVKGAKRKAQSADAMGSDAVSAAVFPNGITPIIRPAGQNQCDEMRKLEGRIEAAAPIWSDAAAVKGEMESLRKDYESALGARKDAKLGAAAKRAVRDMAKEDLLDVFAKVAGIVKIEFPRNAAMQELFFMPLDDRGGRVDEAEGEDDTVPGAGPQATP